MKLVYVIKIDFNLNYFLIFDYSEQFWRKYKNNRKFSTLIINSAHEETGEVLKYLDDLILNYLNSLYNVIIYIIYIK